MPRAATTPTWPLRGDGFCTIHLIPLPVQMDFPHHTGGNHFVMKRGHDNTALHAMFGGMQPPRFHQKVGQRLFTRRHGVRRIQPARERSVGRAEVRAMLNELQGKALFQEVRDETGRHRQTDGYHFPHRRAGLGVDQNRLEMNSLRVNGAQIEVLDAVLTWRSVEA